MTEPVEEWRAVYGYEDYYEVSVLGRVRSLDRTVIRCDGHTARVRGRMMKQHPAKKNNQRVWRVRLSMDSDHRQRPVSHLVYEAFVGQIPDGYRLFHKDTDAKNNAKVNLELTDAPLLGNRKHREVKSFCKLNEEDVMDILTSPANGRSLANLYQVSEATISNIRHRKVWAHIK